MRIDRLVLARYGHFTDFTLDFGEIDAAGVRHAADFHLVYGRNETGKSTTLHAIVDLLFGMPSRSPFNFLHDYDALEIRARLSQPGNRLELRRFKNYLGDREGLRIAESLIDTQGLDRKSFMHRFTVDDDTLQQGGEEILLNRGDLGESLFSATTGLADVHERLETAMAPSRRFYDGGRQKGIALYEMRRELEAMDEELKRIDLNARRYRQQREAADAASDACREHTELVGSLQQTLDRLQRLQHCRGTARRLTELRAARERLPAAAELPAEWIGEYRSLFPEYSRQTARLTALREELERQRGVLRQLNPERTLLQHATGVDEQLAARGHRDALAEQIAGWRDECTALQQRFTVLAQSIDCPVHAGQLPEILPEKLLERIESQLQLCRDALATKRRAEQECQEAQNRIHTHGSLPAVPAAMSLLENLEALIDTESPIARLEQLEITQSALERDLARAIAALAPWRGQVDTLGSLAVPELSQVTGLIARQRAQDNALERFEQQHWQTQQDIDALERELIDTADALQQQCALELARERRDAAWTAHQALLDTTCEAEQLQQSARLFADRMCEHDSCTARCLEIAVDIAKQRQMARQRTRLERSREQVAAELRRAQAERQCTRDRIHTLLEACGLPTGMPLVDLPDWLARREMVLELLDRRDRLHQEAVCLQRQTRRLQQRLTTLLAASLAGQEAALLDGADVIELRALARQRIEALRRDQLDYIRICQTREELERDLARRRTALTAQRSAADTALQELRQLLADSWLADWSVDRITASSAQLRTLRQLAVQQTELAQRIAVAETQQARHRQQLIACLAALQALPDTDRSQPVLETALDSAAAALDQTREQERERRQRLAEIERLRQQSVSLHAELEPLQGRLESMRARAGVRTFEALENALENGARRQALDAQIRELEYELLDALDTGSLDDAVAQLQAADGVELDAEIVSSRTRLEQARSTLNELHHQYRSLAEPLDALCGDAAAARLVEQRENLRLEMADLARQALAARAGQTVVFDSLRRFREHHRSSMLLQARDAFVALTDGHFSDLVTQPAASGGGERLIAVRPSGQSLHAAHMSKGTRFQLYLALRIAAYHEYCRQRAPLPFIADDILETFDDRRAAAACRQLAAMARHGQVIYLTHHRHLIRIAQEVAGTALCVHELPSRGLGLARAQSGAIQ